MGDAAECMMKQPWGPAQTASFHNLPARFASMPDWLLLVLVAIILAYWAQQVFAGRDDPLRPRFELSLGDRLNSEQVVFDGQTYLARGPDLAASRFLARLEELRNAAAEGAAPLRLLALRPQFDRLVGYEPVVGLLEALQQGDDTTRQLAIWLLGRTRHPLAARGVEPFVRNGNRRIRKEAARALRRLRHRAGLAELAANDPDERIRRMAAEPAGEPLDARIRRYLSDVKPTGGNRRG
jgi:hypothetical protein